MFSAEGLRTLVFGTKKLTADECHKWLDAWDRIVQLGEENDSYNNHTAIIENGLLFSGVSGIEDALQDNLHDTLTSLADAGIKTWMLTGDKTLTAVNIAKTAGLSLPNCPYLNLTSDDCNSENLKVMMEQYIAQ